MFVAICTAIIIALILAGIICMHRKRTYSHWKLGILLWIIALIVGGGLALRHHVENEKPNNPKTERVAKRQPRNRRPASKPVHHKMQKPRMNNKQSNKRTKGTFSSKLKSKAKRLLPKVIIGVIAAMLIFGFISSI